MKTFSHLRHVAEFFLEWEKFEIKFAEKIKIHILWPITFTRKSCRLWDNVAKYGGARDVANDYDVALNARLGRLQ
jgi:hypothetical protein